ncbi:MAG: GNAT family N-acetyltransferase [Gemmatimonadaceae bacterium]
MLPELVTARLDLRPATEKDLDILWTLWTDPEVRRFLWDDVSISRERAAETLRQSLAQSAEGLGLWTVRTRNDGRFVGCAGLLPTGAAVQFQRSLAGTVEPLITLAPAAWHQGYTTEALERVITYAFTELALTHLVSVIDVPNEASHRVIKRLGFRMIGESAGPRYELTSYRLRARD